jgi:acetyl-CoA C-acetyltransferase
LHKKITIADVLASPVVADPLSILDCSPISDGAASLVLCSERYAKKLHKQPVFIRASSLATDSLVLAQRDTITSMLATQLAMRSALKQSSLSLSDINVIELHDAFSTAELITLEDCGFFEPGKAIYATLDRETYIDGKLPVNPSGGLKANGHPVGATGIGQAVEIVQQLREQCGQRQVKGSMVGMTHSMGGIGSTVAIHIFTKE